MFTILVLTTYDGSRESENAVSAYYKDMWQAAARSAKRNELPAAAWQRIDISRMKETDVRNIMPAVERADAIVFLTYTHPPINLHLFLKSIGAHAQKPYRLPEKMLGLVFIDKEKKNPEDQYYFADLIRLAKQRMKMDLSPGRVIIEKALSRRHTQFALDLVGLLEKKQIRETMLEPS